MDRIGEAPLVVTSDRVLLQRRGRTRLLAWAGLLGSTAGFVGVFAGPPVFAAAGLLWFIGWLTSASALLRLRFSPIVSSETTRGSHGELVLDDQGLTLSPTGRRARTYPRAKVREGWLELRGPMVTALMTMANGDLLCVGVDDVAHGTRLLDAAGVAAGQRVMKMRLASHTIRSSALGCLALVGSIFATLTLLLAGSVLVSTILSILRGSAPMDSLVYPLLFTVGCLLVFYGIIWATTPPLAVIGTDGIAVFHLLRRRYIPFTRVTGVDLTHQGVALHLGPGKTHLLPTRSGRDDFRRDTAVATETLLHRVRESIAAARLGTAGQVRAALLDREGRDLSAWKSRLDDLGSGKVDYRSTSLSAPEIAQVLEDAGAPAERRIAAAFVLARDEAPEIKRRVRAAVESCADERLREALAGAAAGTIAIVEEEEEESNRRRERG